MQAAFELSGLNSFQAYADREKRRRIVGVERSLVSDHGLKHGDTVFLDLTSENGSAPAPVCLDSQPAASVLTDQTRKLFRWDDEVSRSEDEVDVKLWSMSGQIERPRDDKLCRHGPNGKCLHCTPLEAYDEAYLKEHKIKHMSFHAYLRKMTRGADG